MSGKVILNVPENRKYDFYQCVDYNCEKISSRIFTPKENGVLVSVPKEVPEFLHSIYLKSIIIQNKVSKI